MTGTSPADQAARDRIRDEHNRTLFVEAGAGTGKTTALVARVVEMVARGHLDDLSGLAAITFTENAAAELRSRIREALEAAERGSFHGRTYDAAQRQRCAAALRHLDEATISTLHGFAARILAEVPLEAGVPRATYEVYKDCSSLRAIARASGIGTAFPICRAMATLEPTHL